MRRVLSEVLGLFVDDAGLAAATLAWVAAGALVLPRLGLPPAVPPLLLFAGLAALLAESVLRGARPPPAGP